MTPWSIFLVIVAAAFPLSAIASRQVQRKIQPVRLELARRGETMLLRESLSEDMRSGIQFMLETAFGLRWMLVLSWIAAPFVALALIVSSRLRRSLSATMRLSEDRDYRELNGLHSSILLANNPVLFPVTGVWIALWFMPALAIARVFDAAAPHEMDEGALMLFVERRKHALAHAA